MLVEYDVSPSSNPLGLVTGGCIPCDCSFFDCNPNQKDFAHRQLPAKKRKSRLAWSESSNLPRGTQVKQENAPLERKSIVERSKV